MMLLQVVFFNLFLFRTSLAGPIPTTNNGIKVYQRPSCRDCVFPFLYNDRLHHTCTNIDGEQRKWCRTGRNLAGNWAYCLDETCPGVSVASTPQINVDPRNEVGKCYCGIPNYPASHRQRRSVGGFSLPVGAYPWQVIEN